jgi:hypothetical protein
VTEFERFWARHYPNIEPVGYELRGAGARHWVRFHSLLESKRYPDTEAEWDVLLARQNELAASVLGENRECWLVQSHWESDPDVPDIAFQDGNDPFRATAEFDLKSALVTLREPGTEFKRRWEAFVGLTSWSAGRFDGLLRDIANERASPTLWCSNETGAVFAPYDGGVDLFLPDEGRVRELAEKHAAWLPAHALGL